jgi:uncharacterized protein YbaR (Trm112 family)
VPEPRTPTPDAPAALDPATLALLRCPKTGQPLRQQGDRLVTADGTIAYPIADGLPVLVPSAARPAG